MVFLHPVLMLGAVRGSMKALWEKGIDLGNRWRGGFKAREKGCSQTCGIGPSRGPSRE